MSDREIVDVPMATVLEIRQRYKHVLNKPTVLDFNRVLCDVVLAINDRDEARAEIERLQAACSLMNDTLILHGVVRREMPGDIYVAWEGMVAAYRPGQGGAG